VFLCGGKHGHGLRSIFVGIVSHVYMEGNLMLSLRSSRGSMDLWIISILPSRRHNPVDLDWNHYRRESLKPNLSVSVVLECQRQRKYQSLHLCIAFTGICIFETTVINSYTCIYS